MITETLGSDFPGVFVSDCLNIYDGATAVQHKCYSHHLKTISQAMDRARAQGGSTQWLAQLRSLLKTAIVLKSVRGDLAADHYQQYCRHLEQRVDVVLAQARAGPEDQSIAQRLLKQRDHLFRVSLPRGSRCDQQPGRAPASPGGH